MSEDLFELSPEELDGVAGGRALTERERRSQEEMRSKLNALLFRFRKEGRIDEVEALNKRWKEASKEWRLASSYAPKGSPEILFSDYFSLDDFEEKSV
ncbi:MAG: hypothetical protein IJR00_11400 [Lachnospiraceae bacterium]|nr:hypothetical protein [Lachnospiraceae bacterium]